MQSGFRIRPIVSHIYWFVFHAQTTPPTPLWNLMCCACFCLLIVPVCLYCCFVLQFLLLCLFVASSLLLVAYGRSRRTTASLGPPINAGALCLECTHHAPISNALLHRACIHPSCTRIRHEQGPKLMARKSPPERVMAAHPQTEHGHSGVQATPVTVPTGPGTHQSVPGIPERCSL
jgi:hypothetical protein